MFACFRICVWRAREESQLKGGNKVECNKWNAKGTYRKASAERHSTKHLNTLVGLRPRADLNTCAHSARPWFWGKGNKNKSDTTNKKQMRRNRQSIRKTKRPTKHPTLLKQRQTCLEKCARNPTPCWCQFGRVENICSDGAMGRPKLEENAIDKSLPGAGLARAESRIYRSERTTSGSDTPWANGSANFHSHMFYQCLSSYA